MILDYLINRGWKFKGDRMSDEQFETYIKSFYDIKNTHSYNTKTKELLLTRNGQLCFVFDLNSSSENWRILYPRVEIPLFEVNHIKQIKELVKTAKKVVS